MNADSARYPSLADRRVVVTGGGSGIGAAIVHGFASQGAQVHFLDIQDSEDHTAGSSGSPPRYHACDLTDPAAIDAVFRQIGPVDVLVNNAANDDRHALEDIDAAYFDQRVAVNLRHYFLCARAVAAGMRNRARGVILNLGSISWRLGLPNLPVYEAAKAGIEGMTRGLARDLGPFGIRVACIAPGSVATPRQLKWYPDPAAEAEVLAKQCLNARIEPRDVAALALFLASDDARFCTSHTYFVDAGWA
ncbi:MAG TPA: SDR family oxidoreductase [Caulobacteraceae bacterium]|nr:SDR family oxidoreductase [Caulobacteraceae bacterium]